MEGNNDRERNDGQEFDYWQWPVPLCSLLHSQQHCGSPIWLQIRHCRLRSQQAADPLTSVYFWIAIALSTEATLRLIIDSGMNNSLWYSAVRRDARGCRCHALAASAGRWWLCQGMISAASPPAPCPWSLWPLSPARCDPWTTRLSDRSCYPCLPCFCNTTSQPQLTRDLGIPFVLGFTRQFHFFFKELCSGVAKLPFWQCVWTFWLYQSGRQPSASH